MPRAPYLQHVFYSLQIAIENGDEIDNWKDDVNSARLALESAKDAGNLEDMRVCLFRLAHVAIVGAEKVAEQTVATDPKQYACQDEECARRAEVWSRHWFGWPTPLCTPCREALEKPDGSRPQWRPTYAPWQGK